MRLDVLIDTSAWIAVSDTSDKYHQEAKATYQRLISDKHHFLTTNLVIAETYIIIRRNGGHGRAMRWLRSLHESPRLQKVWSDAGLESLAEDLLEKHSDQGFSFTDAVSFVVMQERGLKEAFTFDKHFAAMGFHMLPAGNS